MMWNNNLRMTSKLEDKGLQIKKCVNTIIAMKDSVINATERLENHFRARRSTFNFRDVRREFVGIMH